MPEKSDVVLGEEASPSKIRRISSKPPRKGAADAATKAEINAVISEHPEIPKEGQKRPNRRRRGKGKSAPNEAELPPVHKPTIAEETINLTPGEPAPRPPKTVNPEPYEKPRESRPQTQHTRHKLDPQKLAKNAWKIFLAEVSEEGVALISDNDARELARRCFRLSEIFLEEEDRRG